MQIYLHWPYRIFCWLGWHEYTTPHQSGRKRAIKTVWTCDVCGKRRGPFRWERE